MPTTSGRSPRSGVRSSRFRRPTSCRTPCSSKTPRSCSMRSPSSPGPAQLAAAGNRRCRGNAGRFSSSAVPLRARDARWWRRAPARTCALCRPRYANESAGVRQLADFISPYGYEVREVQVDGCLHLKSAVTEVAAEVIVINPEWVNGQMFPDHAIIEVDPSEPAAANVLRIGDTVVSPSAHPRTNARCDPQPGYSRWMSRSWRRQKERDMLQPDNCCEPLKNDRTRGPLNSGTRTAEENECLRHGERHRERSFRYEDYRRLVAPTLEKYGGRFIARGGSIEVLEGDWHPARLVLSSSHRSLRRASGGTLPSTPRRSGSARPRRKAPC